MIKKNIVILILMLTVSMIAGSCSVKEDRSTCPCRLYLDFTLTDTLVTPQVSVFVSGSDADRSHKDIKASEFMPEYIIEVPRDIVHLNVYAGLEGLPFTQQGLVIPTGEQCPELYSFSEPVDARGEIAASSVDMHKNHCVMSVIIKKDDDLSYGLCVKSNVCGYDQNGAPLPGPFAYSPESEEDGTYRVVLPRQIDSDMRLEVDDGADVLRSFALGQYIVAGGYDWAAEDLEDVEVEIDWSCTSITLTVKGWEWVEEYEIVI